RRHREQPRVLRAGLRAQRRRRRLRGTAPRGLRRGRRGAEDPGRPPAGPRRRGRDRRGARRPPRPRAHPGRVCGARDRPPRGAAVTPIIHTHARPCALTIAGSDSGGGAGIQADLTTFAALAVFGPSAITAVTAQNTRGVTSWRALPPPFVAEQMRAVLSDLPIA